MRFGLPRGMRDLAPEEYTFVERVREAFARVCRLYGFQLMEPSPIEALATLEAKSGPAIREEIYCFSDKSGRDLGLRFDLTVGMTRYVTSSRGLRLPLKLGAFSGMWRYDEPQYGRYRWFYQWDAEIFGSPSPEADAEIIDFTAALMTAVGLPSVSIEIGDRKVVEAYLREKLRIREQELVLDLLRAVDKVGKKPRAEIIREYEEKGVKRQVLDELLEFGGIRGTPDAVLGAVEQRGLSEGRSLAQVVDSLQARGVRNVSLNLGVVRGLDYYTGVVFEVFDMEDPSLGALAGGGRYDGLPALFGRADMAATGVAGGVERTVLALKRRGVRPEIGVPKVVFVACASRELSGEAARVAAELRRAGLVAELDLVGKSLRRQMELASALGAGFVVLLAAREIAEGLFVLRDMTSGREQRIPRERLVSKLKELVG